MRRRGGDLEEEGGERKIGVLGKVDRRQGGRVDSGLGIEGFGHGFLAAGENGERLFQLVLGFYNLQRWRKQGK